MPKRDIWSDKLESPRVCVCANGPGLGSRSCHLRRNNRTRELISVNVLHVLPEVSVKQSFRAHLHESLSLTLQSKKIQLPKPKQIQLHEAQQAKKLVSCHNFVTQICKMCKQQKFSAPIRTIEVKNGIFNTHSLLYIATKI